MDLLFSPEEKREAITYDQRWNDPRGKEDLTCSGSCTGLWVSSAALEDKLQAKVETPLYLKKKKGVELIYNVVLASVVQVKRISYIYIIAIFSW